MKVSYFVGLTALLITSVAPAARAISVEPDEEPSMIYCVSTKETSRGVYTLPTSGEYTATKLSGTTYIQYDFSKSGGTFVSKSTVYGTRDTGYSVFAGKATANGNGEGPWSESFWSYRTSSGVALTYEIVATDMTSDPVTGNIYGWFKADNAGTAYRLGIYDGESMTMTPVGPTSTTKISAIAADADGQLWGICGYLGKLYTIDKSSGALTEVGPLKVVATEPDQSAAFDHSTGKLYWGANESLMKASLYSIDVTDCSCEKIYEFPMGKRFNAFYIPAPDSKKGSPAQVTDLAATFDGSKVNVTFTVPDTTVDGAALSGDVTYTMTLDGEPLDNGTIAAGTAYAKAFEMEAGSHTLTLTLSNKKGTGPKTVESIYAGFDTPVALPGLTASVTGNTVHLTWQPPTGANGGTVDPALVTYDVTRIPDFAEVASGLTECEFTDQIPEGPIAAYCYSVTVVYDGDVSVSASTDPMLVGNPHTVPYRQDFDSVNSLSDIAYKVVDMEPGTNSWILASDPDSGNKYLEVKGGNSAKRSDYVFTAPISFKAGIEYTLRIKVANSSSSENMQLRVFLSRSQTSADGDFIRPYIAPNINVQLPADQVGTFEQREMTFTLEEDGDFFLGFYDFTTYWNSNAIRIDDIEITLPVSISDATAAAPVTVKIAESNVVVGGKEGTEVSVYAITGVKVASGSISRSGSWTSPALTPGSYIVKAGSSTNKIIIR